MRINEVLGEILGEFQASERFWEEQQARVPELMIHEGSMSDPNEEEELRANLTAQHLLDSHLRFKAAMDKIALILSREQVSR